MQTPNSQTPSLLGFTPTKATLLVTSRSHSKVSDHLHLLILYVVTSTTRDLEILQGILPIEDFREVWVQKPQIYNLRHTMPSFLSKSSKNVVMVFLYILEVFHLKLKPFK